MRKIKYRWIHVVKGSSLWQYKVYAGIRRGSLERRHQTTVGWRDMRTCYGRMLKFIRCMRNKLGGSSDVAFGGDRRKCKSLRR